VLDENVCKNLRKILTKKSTKRLSKRNRGKEDDPQEDDPQEDDSEEAAAAGTNNATSGVTTALSTTLSDTATALSTASEVASPTESALLGERALSENDRTQPLWAVKEDEVAIPAEIADSFERWKADPSVFLRSDIYQAPTSVTEYYDYALSVRTSTATNKILWRFITTVFYDIISARSRSDVRSITKEGVEFAVAAICESGLYKREVVEADLISWTKDRAKNRALADKLGSTGCYFYYPPHLSEWM
jgi:hypothetical protein